MVHSQFTQLPISIEVTPWTIGNPVSKRCKYIQNKSWLESCFQRFVSKLAEKKAKGELFWLDKLWSASQKTKKKHKKERKKYLCQNYNRFLATILQLHGVVSGESSQTANNDFKIFTSSIHFLQACPMWNAKPWSTPSNYSNFILSSQRINKMTC